MNDQSARLGGPAHSTTTPNLPPPVDRATFQGELDRLRIREKAHTHEGDAIAPVGDCRWSRWTPGLP
jgi:hypothetical protein